VSGPGRDIVGEGSGVPDSRKKKRKEGFGKKTETYGEKILYTSRRIKSRRTFREGESVRLKDGLREGAGGERKCPMGNGGI